VPDRSSATLDGLIMVARDLKNAAARDIRAVEAILRRWDPINVEPGRVAPSDEYDSYAPHIVSMVESGCTVAELTAHLECLCVETMGLKPRSSASQAYSSKFAALILETLRPSNPRLERP
jgi:hypothetical protein